MRAPSFVATRQSAILVPGFYAKKKKRSSGTLRDIDSRQNSDSGGGSALEQPQGVTTSNNISIEVKEINVPLRRNEGDGINREDYVNQNKIKEIIVEKLKTPKETKVVGEVNNEELSLA